VISAWIQLVRPRHWVKNLFVLAPLLFAQHLFDGRLVLLSLAAFGAFVLVSSGVYAFNDVQDAARDRAHPLKKHRPIASGCISPATALVAAAGFSAAGLGIAFALGTWVGLCAGSYLVLNVLYSRFLKKIALLDVLTIAAGFVLRVVSGALAIGVVFSVWLIVCTFFLACLLGFGKRRHELRGMGAASEHTRPALKGYTERGLRWMEGAVATVTLVAYCLYTLAPGTLAKFGTHNLVWTLPFAALGMFRFLKLVGSTGQRSPTDALVTDWFSWLNMTAWVGVVVWVLYR
jgi:decaprenyl-phosphate phosphoribosyltransferase